MGKAILWARVGMSIEVTDDELARMKSGELGRDEMRRIIEKTGKIDGETYFPTSDEHDDKFEFNF